MDTLTTNTHGLEVGDLILIVKRYHRLEEIYSESSMIIRPVPFIMNLYYRIRATLNLYMNIVWKS